MRWRMPLLIGVLVCFVGLVIGSAIGRVLAPDEPLAAAVVVSLISGAAFVVVLGFLAGWFGRERDDLLLVAIGFGVAATVVVNVAAMAAGNWHVVVLVFGPAAAVIGASAGRITWWVGNAICELRGLASAPELIAPAYPAEVRSDAMWTTRAADALRETLDALADRIAPGAPVDALAIGVLVGFPRDRAVAVALAVDRLGVQPVDMDGVANSQPIVLEDFQVSEVSFRGEGSDGTIPKRINAFDDIIGIRTSDHRTIRLRLPYGTRGTGARTGGPDAIRDWLRAVATPSR